MLCDRCKKRPATIKKIQVVNYQKREINLCNECAFETGYMKNNIGSLFSSFLSMDGLYSDASISNKKCPVCGFSMDTFNTTGKLGCSECYSTFLDEIRPLLRKIHGNCLHKGATPYVINNVNFSTDNANVNNIAEDKKARSFVKNDEIGSLRQQMQDAISREEFEKAAELRDKIKALEEGE